MKFTTLAALAAIAIGTTFAAVPANAGPLSFPQVKESIHDAKDDGYKVKYWSPFKIVLGKKDENTTAYKIKYTSRENVDRDTNPCYAQFGAFHRSIGGLCVYDPDMYVSKVDETPSTTSCTHSHIVFKKVWMGWGWTETQSSETDDGACPVHHVMSTN